MRVTLPPLSQIRNVQDQRRDGSAPPRSTTDAFLESIAKTYADGVDLVRRKNADYANNDDPFKNFRASAQIAGVDVGRAILVRALDKMSRISNLLDRDPKVRDEKIEDSILDGINYLGILKAWIELGAK